MNVRRYLAGTLAIWRSGGSVRLVVADLWAGVRWAARSAVRR